MKGAVGGRVRGGPGAHVTQQQRQQRGHLTVASSTTSAHPTLTFKSQLQQAAPAHLREVPLKVDYGGRLEQLLIQEAGGQRFTLQVGRIQRGGQRAARRRCSLQRCRCVAVCEQRQGLLLLCGPHRSQACAAV